MRLLIASVTNARPEILGPHLDTVRWQAIPPGWTVDTLYLVDPEAPAASRELLTEKEISWRPAGAKPEDASYEVREETHIWSLPTFYWLAEQKQHILDHARDLGYDALLLVDSDLLLDFRAIASLIHADKPIVSGVFWTRWQPDAPELPQVWLQHPYGFSGLGKIDHQFLSELRSNQLVEVVGLGAFTLIHSSAFPFIDFLPLIEGLPSEGMWQGEDRHFCVRANRAHVPLWADAWPRIFHVYRPSDIFSIKQEMEKLAPRDPVPPTRTTYISAVLEPLEEPELPGFHYHLRGQLATLPILPEISSALSTMLPGEEQIISVTFPYYWQIPEYRNQRKALRIRLLDTREA
jgi:hypothetical protein